ncbi:glycosyltransferase family 39 protein [Dyella acidiphila]|uniref:Glycosyltransferase family 39 protein n=1 Tax=Dyella acidiphila TaxID=2775866 RepID=A0ABR9G6V3_9GAMM|nr:glycosyltransferase family 39 protein [Dyella acidiphila]MBE1159760.1 glycosyltransferase family 39 protein [Dyella acidiphila]
MAADRTIRTCNEIWSKGDIAWLAAILLLGLLVRLFRIDHQPFWLDEALTSQRIHLGVNGLISDSFTNRHMPTYFLLLQLISQFAHSGDAWLRIPSALFGAMSAGVVFAMARRIGGRSAGLVAGLLMALSPLQVQYGQEARSYTLVTLLIAVALWGLLRLAQDPARASLDLRQQGAERWGWGSYVLGSIGALDVLGDAAPWLLASNLSLLLVWYRLHASASPLRDAFRRNWLLSAAAITLCCVPFYGEILTASRGHMLQNFNWIPELSWQHLWVVTGSVYLMRMTAVVKFDLLHTAVPVLGAMVALAACAGLFRVRHRLEGRVLLLGVLVLPVLILSISLFKSMLLPRYILWSAVPFFVLVGLGVAALPRRTLPVAITALFLMGAVNLGPVYRVETKPRWDMAAATLAANVRPGDTVFTADPNAPTMLAVLQPRNSTPIQANAVVTSQLDQAMARWKQGGRIWAVNGRSALGEREELAAFKSRMAALGSPAVEIPQGKEITILMFPAPEDAVAN